MFSFTFEEHTIYFYEIYAYNGVFMNYGYKIERNEWKPSKRRRWRNVKPTVEIIDKIIEEQWLTDMVVVILLECKKELEEVGTW